MRKIRYQPRVGCKRSGKMANLELGKKNRRFLSNESEVAGVWVEARVFKSREVVKAGYIVLRSMSFAGADAQGEMQEWNRSKNLAQQRRTTR